MPFRAWIHGETPEERIKRKVTECRAKLAEIRVLQGGAESLPARAGTRTIGARPEDGPSTAARQVRFNESNETGGSIEAPHISNFEAYRPGTPSTPDLVSFDSFDASPTIPVQRAPTTALSEHLASDSSARMNESSFETAHGSFNHSSETTNLLA